MKNLANLQQVKELIKTSKFHTFDYCSESDITSVSQSLEIETENLNGTLYIFNNPENLHQYILTNATSFDPFKGSDDQYFDYSPSTLESIFYGLSLASPEIQQKATEILTPKLKSFISDNSQDEIMRYIYQAALTALENKQYAQSTSFYITLK